MTVVPLPGLANRSLVMGGYLLTIRVLQSIPGFKLQDDLLSEEAGVVPCTFMRHNSGSNSMGNLLTVSAQRVSLLVVDVYVLGVDHALILLRCFSGRTARRCGTISRRARLVHGLG